MADMWVDLTDVMMADQLVLNSVVDLADMTVDMKVEMWAKNNQFIN